MTVKELVAHLQRMPQDAVVIYDNCSDYDMMELEQVTMKTVVLRGGRYCDPDYYPAENYPRGEKRVEVTVCHFPGN